MAAGSILLPVFAQAGLSFFLCCWMAKVRRDVFRSNEIRWQDIALKQTHWPETVQKISNAFQNQFEIPILFYVLIALMLSTGTGASPSFVTMEWIFVASRIVHAFIFTTSNYVPARGLAYISGVVVLLAMWVLFLLEILQSGP
jgi:hypothetical protein